MEISFQAVDSGGDEVPNDGLVVLAFRNDDTEDHTVTISVKITEFESHIYGDAYKNDVELTVTAESTGYIGPFKTAAYNNGSGNIEISYSGTTLLQIAPLKIEDVKRTG